MKALNKILKAPPWVWGFSYLFAIPIFAVIFQFNSNGFYHSTLSQEGLIKDYENQISVILIDSIEDWPLKYRPKGFEYRRVYLSDLKMKIPENSGLVSYLQFKFEILLTDSPFNLVSPEKTGKKIIYHYECLSYTPRISLDMRFNSSHIKGNALLLMLRDIDMGESSDHECIKDKTPVVNIERDSLSKSLLSLFETDLVMPIRPDPEESTQLFVFPISSDIEKFVSLLNDYEQVINGEPLSGFEGFWTMFYFSTVTITTLGYGDILPISTRTRILVSVESIIGVILIGLFFFSLSQQPKIVNDD